ncbi:serine/threonine protein kinase [Micromonospora purpureochromogenes]|uniref:non-specific serine/threonine protein kinase n=1 Tax=Micromonospora purpureochromogenes TaxID=47872 RepID=A0A1C4URE4_9ACTN|nr:serine/threonine-protein kinase [Micromonospora purpureochromogenes]SCE74266.1 serine/threonine protein kinase [Micromonospora purpureochromogenes]
MLRRVLDGRYQSEELLGSGGMGEVWRGRDLRLDRPVAIKVLSAAGLEEPMAAERFDREARAAARLTHPHIVGVYDFGTEGDDSYLVMELVEGRTVSALIVDGPLPVEQAVSIAVQACDAIAAAHAAGVVHRDVKPGNLIVTPSGIVKICDFGIARLAETAGHNTLTGPATKLGTSSYMAPEQALGKPVDPRTDLYGLGCTLYAMLAGAPPFSGDPLSVLHQHVNDPPAPLRDRRPDVPVALDALLSELLAKDPAARPTSAREVRDRLAALMASPDVLPAAGTPLVSGTVAPAGAPGPSDPGAAGAGPSAPDPVAPVEGPGTGGRPVRRRRLAVLLAAGILGVALLALAAAALRAPAGDTSADRGTRAAQPTVAPAPASTAAQPSVGAAPVTVAPTTPSLRTVAPTTPTSRAPSPRAASRTPAPPADPVVAMRLSIQEQVEAGQLNPDAAKDLHSKVDAIAKEIAEDDPEQAEEQVKKLRDKLSELLRGGRLTAAGYDDLTAGVDRIAAALQ